MFAAVYFLQFRLLVNPMGHSLFFQSLVSFVFRPLGPFVPAPPEVAMRMFRDQGGPGPYEGNGGPRGRKGRSGPPVGPSPMMAVPPGVRQDPRRIRR